MIQVDNRDRRGYRSELGQADTLTLEKGYCHFSIQGHKDFLNAITAYEPEAHGVAFKVSTFRGNRASVRIAFPEETVFRFTMLPEGVAACGNAVFSFPGKAQAQVLEDESFIYAKTAHLELRFRKLPWEMTVILDGRELTGEQIKDFNVDQRYKSLPCGFALDDDGRVLHTYETMYMHCDESFYGLWREVHGFQQAGTENNGMAAGCRFHKSGIGGLHDPAGWNPDAYGCGRYQNRFLRRDPGECRVLRRHDRCAVPQSLPAAVR